MNLASRLCDEARPGQVLISARALASAADQIESEPAGELTLKGFAQPVPAFSVLDVKPNATDLAAVAGASAEPQPD
jgi:class 3 adenylate cyclase